MDIEDFEESNCSVNSSSSTALVGHDNTDPNAADNYLNYDFGYPFNFGNPSNDTSRDQEKGKPLISPKPKNHDRVNDENGEKSCAECKNSAEPLAHVNLESLKKLKDSTRKLICLLEEIQSKTRTKSFDVYARAENRLTELLRPIPDSNALLTVTDVIGAKAFKKLENQAKTLGVINIEEEKDDCSVYKRLTRKCNCLNHYEYNDFIIHFNEDTKYFTSNPGEIIKNIRILKKFLYMGGDYSRHALMFLNEGLSDSSHTEKVEIIQGCSYADVCNIFETHSIVTICISWPCKYDNVGDCQTQALTAGLLYKLAQLEEGRRYLKFSSKITNDLKKVLRKKASLLDFDTLESLNATLNLIQPPIDQFTNVTYYCKPADEGFGVKTLNALVHLRQYMTLNEIFTHLDLIHHLSNSDSGKQELKSVIPIMLNLFKNILLEYDNSEMNIIITNILNNMVSRSMMRPNELPKTLVMADTATEAIVMKNETIQIPPRKGGAKKSNKAKLGLTPNKSRQPSKRKDWDPPPPLNRSRKFSEVADWDTPPAPLIRSKKKESRTPVIVVPVVQLIPPSNRAIFHRDIIAAQPVAAPNKMYNGNHTTTTTPGE